MKNIICWPFWCFHCFRSIQNRFKSISEQWIFGQYILPWHQPHPVLPPPTDGHHSLRGCPCQCSIRFLAEGNPCSWELARRLWRLDFGQVSWVKYTLYFWKYFLQKNVLPVLLIGFASLKWFEVGLKPKIYFFTPHDGDKIDNDHNIFLEIT